MITQRGLVVTSSPRYCPASALSALRDARAEAQRVLDAHKASGLPGAYDISGWRTPLWRIAEKGYVATITLSPSWSGGEKVIATGRA